MKIPYKRHTRASTFRTTCNSLKTIYLHSYRRQHTILYILNGEFEDHMDKITEH